MLRPGGLHWEGPQQDVKLELDNPPTEAEIKAAVVKLQPGIVPGIDRIPGEVYVADGVTVIARLTTLFTSYWESEKVAQDLRDAVIVSLYKNKGDKSDCSNYRDITLLSIADKILAKVLLDQLIPTIAEQNLFVSQCSFRTNKRTVDMMLVLRQLRGSQWG